MNQESYNDNKTTSMISGFCLNRTNGDSSHITIRSHAPKWALAWAVLGKNDRHHAY